MKEQKSIKTNTPSSVEHFKREMKDICEWKDIGIRSICKIC